MGPAGVLGVALLCTTHGATVENTLVEDGDNANTFSARFHYVPYMSQLHSFPFGPFGFIEIRDVVSSLYVFISSLYTHRKFKNPQHWLYKVRIESFCWLSEKFIHE